MSMLFGSGGVVALVVGAWAMLWAVRVVPEVGLRRSLPVAFAFAAAIVGFALWTAHAQAVLGLVAWMAAAASERITSATRAEAHTWRPLYAAVLALLALGATLAAVKPRPEPAMPAAQRAVRWYETILLLSLVPPAIVAVVAWIKLRASLVSVTAGAASLTTTLPKMQFLAALGTLADATLLTLALLIAAGRGVRAGRAWAASRRLAAAPTAAN